MMKPTIWLQTLAWIAAAAVALLLALAGPDVAPGHYLPDDLIPQGAPAPR